MGMRRTRGHAAGALIDRAHAKADQQQDHAELEHLRRDRWHFSLQHHQKGAGREQRQRMAQSPARAEPRGLRAAALARHEGRHRSEMIGLERVPHAEQRAQTGARSESQRRDDRSPSEAFKPSRYRFAQRLHTRLLKHPVGRERAREPKEKPARVGRSRLQQLDGLAVRRVSVGSGPGFFSCSERAWIGQPLRSDQALQCGQPVFVVARTVVGFTTSRSSLEFIRQRGGPFFPGVMPLL